MPTDLEQADIKAAVLALKRDPVMGLNGAYTLITVCVCVASRQAIVLELWALW